MRSETWGIADEVAKVRVAALGGESLEPVRVVYEVAGIVELPIKFLDTMCHGNLPYLSGWFARIKVRAP